MDLQFSGRVRITLTGLMNRIPVVSAAQARCVQPLPSKSPRAAVCGSRNSDANLMSVAGFCLTVQPASGEP